MKINHINRKSDFKLLIELKDYDGTDFRLTFWTDNMLRKTFICSNKSGVYTNCTKVDDTHILCCFNQDTFRTGLMMVERAYMWDDTQQPDGEFTRVTEEILIATFTDEAGQTYQANIEITDDETDVTVTPEAVFDLLGGILKGDPGESAYEIAVRHGYTGTEEEWLASLGVLVVEYEERLKTMEGLVAKYEERLEALETALNGKTLIVKS